MYFERLRSLATGIAVCGSGFGTVVFAPLTNYLITTYKWQGSLLVISGIVFFCAVFGYMFRPLVLDEPPTQPPTPKTNGNNNVNNVHNNNKYNVSDHDIPSNTSLLSPSNHQQIIRSHSIGNDMIKNNGNGKGARTAEETSRLATSQPFLNDTLTQRPIKSAASGTLDRPDAFYTGSLNKISRSHTSIHSDSEGRYGSMRARADNAEVDKAEVCGCIPCSQVSL